MKRKKKIEKYPYGDYVKMCKNCGTLDIGSNIRICRMCGHKMIKIKGGVYLWD